MDLLLVLYIFFSFWNKGLPVLGPISDGLGQLPDCCFNNKKKVGEKAV